MKIADLQSSGQSILKQNTAHNFKELNFIFRVADKYLEISNLKN